MKKICTSLTPDLINMLKEIKKIFGTPYSRTIANGIYYEYNRLIQRQKITNQKEQTNE